MQIAMSSELATNQSKCAARRLERDLDGDNRTLVSWRAQTPQDLGKRRVTEQHLRKRYLLTVGSVYPRLKERQRGIGEEIGGEGRSPLAERLEAMAVARRRGSLVQSFSSTWGRCILMLADCLAFRSWLFHQSRGCAQLVIPDGRNYSDSLTFAGYRHTHNKREATSNTSYLTFPPTNAWFYLAAGHFSSSQSKGGASVHQRSTFKPAMRGLAWFVNCQLTPILCHRIPYIAPTGKQHDTSSF